MLCYLPSMISLVLNAFMLFGLNSEIQISMTLGLTYSVFLFLYFLAQKREAKAMILFSGLAYWLLLSFILNANATTIFNEELLTSSLILNLISALVIFIIVILLTLISPLSPFSTLLLLSHSSLAPIMYFNGWALNYFIYIYLGSLLLLAILITFSSTKGAKFNFWPLILIWFITLALFIVNEAALNAGYYSFSFFQNYNFIVMLSTWASLIPALLSEIYGLSYNFDVLSESGSALSFRETSLNSAKQFCNAM